MPHATPDLFFRTPRLVFRPFAPEDLDDLARIAGDPQVVRWVGDGRPLDRAACALWIARSRANVAAHGYGTGALVEAGRMIGWGGFARPEGEPEEIVYGFEQAAWGRGLATEFVGGLVAYAFGALRRPELRATTDAANVGSHRVLQAHGFQRRPWPEAGEWLWVLEPG